MKAEVETNHDGHPLRVVLENGIIINLMSYEERDSIIITMLELIDQKLNDVHGIDEDMLDEVYTDDMMHTFDDLFEPYTTGWKNYN